MRERTGKYLRYLVYVLASIISSVDQGVYVCLRQLQYKCHVGYTMCGQGITNRLGKYVYIKKCMPC